MRFAHIRQAAEAKAFRCKYLNLPRIRKTCRIERRLPKLDVAWFDPGLPLDFSNYAATSVACASVFNQMHHSPGHLAAHKNFSLL
jgi:hypothetical protein